MATPTYGYLPGAVVISYYSFLFIKIFLFVFFSGLLLLLLLDGMAGAANYLRIYYRKWTLKTRREWVHFSWPSIC